MFKWKEYIKISILRNKPKNYVHDLVQQSIPKLEG